MINNLLDELLSIVEADTDIPQTVTDGEEFENYILKTLKDLAARTEFNIESVEHNGVQSFPDLKITTKEGLIFGLEIKFSASGNWSSKGNSVFESLSNKGGNDENGYQEIYVFFGRKPKPKELLNTFEAKYAPYGNCIDKIQVTHSPRFSINMNIGENNLFNTLGHEYGYATFRLQDNEFKNQFLRQYFNTLTNTNEADKWYVGTTTTTEAIDPQLSIQAIPFTSLTLDKKRTIIAEAFILFPTDLFKDKANYSNLINYMISKHFVYSSALRDSFSSGGKTLIINEKIKYPKMLKTFYEHQDIIKKLLQTPEEEFELECFRSWTASFGETVIDREISLEENFEKIISEYSPTLEVEYSNDEGETVKERVIINLTKFYK